MQVYPPDAYKGKAEAAAIYKANAAVYAGFLPDDDESEDWPEDDDDDSWPDDADADWEDVEWPEESYADQDP